MVLRGFFARRVSAGEVDDLLQECHLRVTRGLPALRDRERLAPWVFGIAHNLVAEHHRRRQRSDRERPDHDAVARRAAASDDPDLTRTVSAWLVGMIDRLPRSYADVLRESDVHGRPHREIAARLDLSVSAVKSRVQCGRAMLRDELLACCTLEFDRRGAIRDYARTSAGSCDC